MIKSVVVLLLIAMCCSACSSPSAQMSSVISTDESSSNLSSQSDSDEFSSSSDTSDEQVSSVISTDESSPNLSSQSDSDELSSSSMQKDTIIRSDTSAAPDYQGLTQEQWNKLQDQKEKYGDWLLQKRENEAYSGEVDCPKFIHLWWEDRIDLHLINYVGGDKFNTWTLERFHADKCADIYSFAQYFSITLDELVSLIETSGGDQVYDVETLKRRYAYFIGDLDGRR